MPRNMMDDYWDIQTAKEIVQSRSQPRVRQSESYSPPPFRVDSPSPAQAFWILVRVIWAIGMLAPCVIGFFVVGRWWGGTTLWGATGGAFGFFVVGTMLVSWAARR